MFIVRVGVLTEFLSSNLFREIYTRIGIDPLTMSIYPVTAHMARVVIVPKRNFLIDVCCDVLKKSQL